MSYNHDIDGQLLEMEAEAEKLRARFQKELTERITSHTKKLVDIERSQITPSRKSYPGSGNSLKTSLNVFVNL